MGAGQGWILDLSAQDPHFSALIQEAGVHRIQRVPPTERKGRVHSSSVTVVVLEEGHADKNVVLRDEDIRVEWYSGSGAGGQHRNKHANCARLIHEPTGTIKTAQARSRAQSLKLARAALEEALSCSSRAAQAQDEMALRRTQIGTAADRQRIRTWAFQRGVLINEENGKKMSLKKAQSGCLDQVWSN